MNCEFCGSVLKKWKRPDAVHHFCDNACRGKWEKEHPGIFKRGGGQGKREKNSNWRGDGVSKNAGRRRATRWFASQPCRICGSNSSERHHKDTNTLNNDPSNIDFLCRKHHMEADGRLSKFISNSKSHPSNGLCRIDNSHGPRAKSRPNCMNCEHEIRRKRKQSAASIATLPLFAQEAA